MRLEERLRSQQEQQERASMHEAAASPLSAWESFYVITGAAAAALTGLMFVAITLIAGERARRAPGGIHAFSTPTVVHFVAAFLVAALLSAPWPALWPAGLLLGLMGTGGLVYAIAVVRRLRRTTAYRPVLEDWLWHTILPLAAYVALIVAALALVRYPVPALFGVGAVTVLLLVIGIHNAWDNVTFIAVMPVRPEEGQD
jgi:hypothetical protein